MLIFLSMRQLFASIKHVGNFHKEELITRRLESKHYWFPLPDKDIYLYEGFAQNPGW